VLSARESPVISVVVFVLNAVDTIRRALESVTGADQPPVELLVLDGGSTDGTLDVIRNFEHKIAYWRSYRDGNPTIALNEGVARARGKIICLLPADDWIEPGGLYVVRNEFLNDPELEVLSCGTRFAHFQPDGSLSVDAEFRESRVLEFTMGNIVRCPLTAGRFILRRLYNDVGAYNPDYRMSNDLDFLVRVLLKRPKTKVAPQLVYTYRMHRGSRTLGGDPSMVLQMVEYNAKVAEDHLTNPVLTHDERRELRGLHGRSSARLAWMLLARGRVAKSAKALTRAVGFNPFFPIMVPIWIAQKIRRRGRLFP